jgi:hypothetical protein
MSVIRFGGFLGEIPRIHPRLLPEGNAQTALNTRLDSGALDATKDTSNLKSTVLTNPISLYRYSDAIWLESVTDTDWVNYPISADQYGRIIYADASFDNGPRVTDASIVGGGAPNGGQNVTGFWNLDVPAPEQGFSATLIGTADDEDEIPETRYYVCTFVNSYGAEGPPSPPTNQVEWRSGQTVQLEGLPAVPTGNYNITWRRIYRVNTGSSTNTEYQYLTELAVTSPGYIQISDITQTNPIVITTEDEHGFRTGMEVQITGLAPHTKENIQTIQKTNPVTITTQDAHSLVTGNMIQVNDAVGLTNLNGTRAWATVVNSQIIRLYSDENRTVPIDGTGWSTHTQDTGTVRRVHGMDELQNNNYFISVGNDTQFSLTGIDGTGYQPYYDESDAGRVQQITSTSYNDGVPSESLGEVLPTEIYDAPNDDTVGLVEHPSGFLAGFFGKTLCFSEIGAPHAWPIDYRLATNHDIVGLGVFGNSVVVTTKGWPYIAVGSDPSAMTMVELEIEQACVSKRGIVDFGSAVCYPSSDGLILISGNGAQNITSGIFTRDQWQALSPSTILGFNWEQWYLGFYDDGSVQRGFIIDPFGPELGVQYVNKYATGGYKDIEEDLLYLIISNQIEIWDQGSKLEFTWKSKPVYTPRAVNMAAAKIIADDYPVTVKFYVDDVKRYTRTVDSEWAFRLPGGFRGEQFEIVIEGTRRVSEAIMATTMAELSVTV